ncbi:MAG: hypothetical protein J6P09_02400 [Methanobrevibacter sp.]|nr:hypothetical protein [Methanobrevibacter sp.]
MKKVYFNDDFDVEEATRKINNVMSNWSVYMIDIVGPNWIVYDYEMEMKYLFQFQVDFTNLETRIKLEDLKLNVIHHIEGLKDDTSYRDNLIS